MLRIDSLTKRYGTKLLFQDVSFHFPKGERVAVVGPNGAGKTSLLNILCGLEEGDAGSIIEPNDCAVGYLPQEPNPSPQSSVLLECQAAVVKLWALKERLARTMSEIEQHSDTTLLRRYDEDEAEFRSRGGYEWEAEASSILRGLGFSPAMLQESPKQLSGGWRMRLELARLFVCKPDVLILDEPTNHLDLPSLLWVEDFLRQYTGTLIFVSHDKALLCKLATMILYLAGGQVFAYSGSYLDFLKDYEQRSDQAERQHEQIEKKKAQLQRFIDRFGAKASKASQSKSKEKALERLSSEQEQLFCAAAPGSLHLNFAPAPRANRIVLSLEDVDIGYVPSQPLIAKLSLAVEKGQRIGILGVNGVGKSTLLKTIAGVIPSLSGRLELGPLTRMAYFAQDQLDVFDQDSSVLQNIVKYGAITERQARNLLGSMQFSGTDVDKVLAVLSGGEKTRVGLACAVALQPNFLLLDEPTNHLDLASVDTLISSLQAYDGTLMIVSHNRSVIDSLCDQILVMRDNTQELFFREQIIDYQGLFAPQSSDSLAKKQGDAGAYLRQRALQKKKRAQRKRREDIEAKLEALGSELSQVDANMAGTEDYQKLIDLQEQRDRIVATIDKLETEWLNCD